MQGKATNGKRNKKGQRIRLASDVTTDEAIMNQLIPASNTVTMSSLEMAELTGKRHDSVKRTIETLVGKGVIALPPLADGPKSANGVIEKQYLVGKRESYVVIAQLSPAHIGASVDFWGRTKDALSELLAALESFDVPDDMHGMYVYAIREVESGRIKIGISRNPAARLAQLQTGNSQQLELMAVKPAVSGFSCERDAHKSAASLRIRGEWFSASALEVLQ